MLTIPSDVVSDSAGRAPLLNLIPPAFTVNLRGLAVVMQNAAFLIIPSTYSVTVNFP